MMQIPRFTTRRLMVLVAAVAVLIAVGMQGARLSEVSRSQKQKAAQFASNAAIRLRNAVLQDRAAKHNEEDPLEFGNALERKEMARFLRAEAEKGRRRAEQELQLEQKYEYAARYPWLPVQPDPPPTK